MLSGSHLFLLVTWACFYRTELSCISQVVMKYSDFHARTCKTTPRERASGGIKGSNGCFVEAMHLGGLAWNANIPLQALPGETFINDGEWRRLCLMYNLWKNVFTF